MLKNLPKLWTESASRKENKTAHPIPGPCAQIAAMPLPEARLLLQPLMKFQDPLPISVLGYVWAPKPGFSSFHVCPGPLHS